ncbi:sensor histidine kinase [Micromonospora polyrhachis]|uniref:histidine kinase n=1 Tax=Micromonospora polyrhachis TaxID=1282883 RepID=A0A7W7SSY5_9ACTN|nr:nitrate- and nitrite sensing domain-containing protein [Micromonospora polyrhachis]MBB4960400.1 signal transduction histidine kinase [Micromonospora polyrhachis]
MPIAALLALWIFATTLTVGPALSLLNTRQLLNEVGQPGEALVVELQRERRLTTIYLAGPGPLPALDEQRARTDQAIVDFRRRASRSDVRDVAGDLLNERITQSFTALESLIPGRTSVNQRKLDRPGAVGLYSATIDSIFMAFTAMTSLPDEGLNREARAVIALIQAREKLSLADALLAGAFTAGRFADGEYNGIVQAIGNQQILYATAVAELRPSDRVAYQKMTEGAEFTQMRGLLEQLVARGRATGVPPVTAANWQRSHDPVQEQLRTFQLTAADTLVKRTKPIANRILIQLGLAGVLGLVAIVASAVIALRIGSSLVRRLTALRAMALDMAGERLPAIVGRLRRGEEVEVAREAPPMDFGTDEIGQVGHAFTEVQLTAVRSAVDEAALRRGINEVFLNIARRSQTLLHRQLALLDRMERRTEAPEELEDLFRVDHLATRMRRHAEDLVILAGAAPGRGWRNPVPMIDVIRGAISEVEDYARVDIVTVPPAAIAGRAVGDVIHVLAELIENAASFSPPQTRVQVTGQMVGNGYAIEVEDRGLGMAPEAIEDANRRLADPPEFDPANSARLGLFVVAQLGARHGIRVRLRPSPYGGITAVALVPGDLVTTEPPAVPPSRPTASAAGVPVGPRYGAATEDAGKARLAVVPDRPSTRSGATTPVLTPDGLPSRRSPALTGVPKPDPAASPGAGPAIGGPGLPGSPARPVHGVGDDGLPRRVRQSSLAPQLRVDRTGEVSATRKAAGSRPDEPALRSPTEVRTLMSALQAGTARGRQEAGWPSAGSTPASPEPTASAVQPDLSATAVQPEPTASAVRPDLSAVADQWGAAKPVPADPDDSPVADLGSTESGRDA